MKYRCTVCGYDQMPFPPEDYNICSCCGTEFGYHDRKLTHLQLRRRWAATGAPWFSKAVSPPVGWNWYLQLYRAGLVEVGVIGTDGAALKTDRTISLLAA